MLLRVNLGSFGFVLHFLFILIDSSSAHTDCASHSGLFKMDGLYELVKGRYRGRRLSTIGYTRAFDSKNGAFFEGENLLSRCEEGS